MYNIRPANGEGLFLQPRSPPLADELFVVDSFWDKAG